MRPLLRVTLGGALLALAAPQPPTGGIAFTESAAASGLTFVHEYSPTPAKHLIESVPGGVAAFDYDNDGRTDLFFTNGATSPSLDKQEPRFWNRLYRNEERGKFTDVTERSGTRGMGYSMGAAAADFDNDGDADLFVAGVGRQQLLRNTGRGTFEDISARSGIRDGEWAVAAGWFDYDQDRWLDLFVVNYLQWTPAFDRFCGDESRGIRVYCHPRFFQGLANRLYRNRGDGTFEDVSTASGIGRHVGKGMSVAFADADGDGRLDVFVTNDGVPNFLLRSKGDGTFEEVGLLAGVAVPSHGRAVSSMGADAQDYDNDGHVDIHVTALNGETFPLFKGDGKGGFADATHTSGLAMATTRRSGWCTTFADLDNDGLKDLVTANSHVNDRIESFETATWKQANGVFRNSGGGRFADVTEAAGLLSRAAAHRGCAVADFDADGRLDVAVSALGERAELWMNRTRPAGHWLIVKLVGSANRDAIGARVSIGSQVRTMTSSVGYGSSTLAGMHFGLGTSTAPQRVGVRWPGGKVQIVDGVAVDQTVVVREEP
jgi:hypothetical protein